MNNTIKTILKSVGAVAVIVALVWQAKASVQGARQALELCASTVIPSLLPFMCVSSYILKSDILSFSGKRSKKICRFLFNLPKQAGVIFLMSLVGGYPVGAKLISDSIKSGSLSQNQGKRMLLFCVNPGPAFVVNIVGTAMLGSVEAGVILLVSLCLASFVTGVISRFFGDGKEKTLPFNKKQEASPLVSSVSESITAIMGVCGWIVVFSALLGVINAAPLSENAKQWLNMLSEVTGGCRISAKQFPLPVTALILGWSGFSVHAQIMPYISTAKLRYKHFAVARLFNGALGMGISYLLFQIFPCKISVFSNAGEILPRAVSVSAPATAGLLFLSALVILDLAPKRKV
ncbi:MAG: hypothetical protein IJZ57_07655 [Clostridia bacterium]|nr:hypothetical protein [Clostridia bacterium]